MGEYSVHAQYLFTWSNKKLLPVLSAGVSLFIYYFPLITQPVLAHHAIPIQLAMPSPPPHDSPGSLLINQQTITNNDKKKRKNTPKIKKTKNNTTKIKPTSERNKKNPTTEKNGTPEGRNKGKSRKHHRKKEPKAAHQNHQKTKNPRPGKETRTKANTQRSTP